MTYSFDTECTGQCEQPPEGNVIELERCCTPSESDPLSYVSELLVKDHSRRDLNPWKGDPCPKGVDRSPRCEVCLTYALSATLRAIH